MNHTGYESPFSTRYASSEMQYIFSPEKKFKTWRRLWIALAKAQRQAGLPITEKQIAQLKRFAETINYDDAIAREKECRHDVMSHVYAYGLQCPDAKGIIHLGATSCYVGDNTDVLLMHEGLSLLRNKLLNLIALLADFARKHKTLAALAYTHLQPAQLTTVGKRACLWLYDFYLDHQELSHRLENLPLLGSKGATGTQASFLSLLSGDAKKVELLERLIAQEMGVSQIVPVSGQTYSRKFDSFVLNALAGIAQSAGKFSHDLRILASFKEMEEPFEPEQIGSSAMPYKRNPMRCERITALSRYLLTLPLNPAFTASTQWFERTLDDSANKRIAVAEAFLAADAILNLMLNVCDGLVVYPAVIARRVREELPFMATENIMMQAVKKGGDRQALHERLRQHSVAAARIVKEDGLQNDLLSRIAADPVFSLTLPELEVLLKPEAFVGLAPQQVDRFLSEVIDPLLRENPSVPNKKGQVQV